VPCRDQTPTHWGQDQERPGPLRPASRSAGEPELRGESVVVVKAAKQRPGPLPLKHRKLVTEDGVLGRQGGAGTSHASEGTEDQKEP